MGEFLSYSISSGIILLILMLTYRILLSGENQHAFNRGIILTIYAISFAFIPFTRAIDISTANKTVSIDIIAGEIKATFISEESAPVWGTVLVWIFMAGMAAVTVKTAIIWIHILKAIRAGERVEKNGYILILTRESGIAPFSWLHYVVMSRADYEECGPIITDHELCHICRHHWIDLLLAQIAVIINWFNPAAWILRDELMLTHEYQADMAVIANGHDTKEYQMLLIKKAVGARFPSLANSLNHSKLKKRITMMYKSESGTGSRLKALSLVPMLALALSVTAIPSVKAAIGTIGHSEIFDDKGTEKISIAKTVSNENDSAATHGMRITINGIEATKEQMNAVVAGNQIESITVDKKTKEIQIIKLKDVEFVPAKDNAQSLKTDKIAVIDFGASEKPTADETAETIPQYPGGEIEMYKDMIEELRFPSSLKGKEINTKTMVSFEVYTDGKIDNVKVGKTSGYPELDEEAVRATKTALTKKWTPGRKNGKPATMEMSIPVHFKTE